MTNQSVTEHRKLLNEAIEKGNLSIGLPMWFMPAWRGQWLAEGASTTASLSEYAQVYRSIEGNTSFYALPDVATIERWQSQVPSSFRFTLKIPRSISHSANPLQSLQQELPQLQQIQAQLGAQLGLWMLQLPAQFSAQRQRELWALLDALALANIGSLALECRHLSFFQKDEVERQLLKGLSERGMDRVMFDSRGLFNDHSQLPEVLEAQQKKPRMPLHPIATGLKPVVRFIGAADWQANVPLLQQWRQKLVQWLLEDRQPYLFLHTPSNNDAPGFARWVLEQWGIEQSLWPHEIEKSRTQDLFDF